MPNITFEDSMDIHLGGLKVVLIYNGPTHSDNLIQVHIPEEGVLIAVDLSRAGRSLVFPDFRERSLQKVCKSHQAAAFDFITTLMPSANCWPS